MARANSNFQKLKRQYIFPIIEEKVLGIRAKDPEADIVNLGVGDVALPLAASVSEAICRAVREMSSDKVHGYGPSEGYSFLRRAILDNDYASLGFKENEIFISDGINSDITNISDLFEADYRAAVPNPTYPVYLDTNILSGRNNVTFMPCTLETRFLPKPPLEKVEVIYLCSPNNPTGLAMTKEELLQFVAYAKINRAVLLYDNAYGAFITSPDCPRSIYEIEGAKETAIEFRSFSKSAGFTGLRCGYTVIPKELYAYVGKEKLALQSLWQKRQNIKSNGVSYPIQRGAEATFTPKGKEETRAQVATYLSSGQALMKGLTQMGYECHGGKDSPYIWWKTPSSYTSWEFFDLLLEKGRIVAIPGPGFGDMGEGYVRLSAFTTINKVLAALERIKNL